MGTKKKIFFFCFPFSCTNYRHTPISVKLSLVEMVPHAYVMSIFISSVAKNNTSCILASILNYFDFV